MKLAELKRFAREHLHEYTMAKELILSEPENLTDEEFVIKCLTWLHLLEAEVRQKRST